MGIQHLFCLGAYCIHGNPTFINIIDFFNLPIFNFFFFFYMNIVHTNKYNKKLQSPGALNIKETPGYNKKIM